MNKFTKKDSCLINSTRLIVIIVCVLLITVIMAYFFWEVGHGFLVIFSGIMFAILLDGIAYIIRLYTRIHRSIALFLAVIFLVMLAATAFWFGGTRLIAQAPQLSHQIEQSLNRIHNYMVEASLVPKSRSNKPGSDETSATSKALSYGKQMMGTITDLVVVTVSAIADFFLILILGIYFAIAPGFYLDISAMLIPRNRRSYVIEVVDTIGHALRRWFLGRIMAMILVGILTTIGLYALGVKLSLLLGVIAGLFTYVPYLGAIISAVPAILVGLSNGPIMALYVTALFLVVHIIEGYVFTPLVQKRIVHVAPAFLLIAQLLAGLFAGIFGIFVATPLAITLTIGVQKFYIESFLGESPNILGDETAVAENARSSVEKEGH